MKNKILLLLLLGLSFTLFGACDKTGSVNHEGHEGHDMAQESEIETFYTCPMHPQVREDGPGKCPICHMNLVKIQVDKSAPQAASGSGESEKEQWRCENFPEVTSAVQDVCPLDGTPMVKASANAPGKVIGNVKLRKAQMAHFNPAFFSVTAMKMRKDIRLLGTVLPSEEKESNIPARVPGRVEKVYIESTGSFVKEGAPVVDIYSPQLITGGEEYLIARKNLKENPGQGFEGLVKQSEERLKLWGIKSWQMRKWYRDGEVPRSITVYSPATGVVQKRNAVVGKYFKEGENFFELTELSSVWVEMDVYEHDSAMIELGQEVALEFTALPGLRLKGDLDFISPVLNPESRTLKVRTTIKNPSGRLKPGMVAESILQIEMEGTPLVVPRSAIIDTGKRKVVWVKVSEQAFQAKTISTGFESQGYVEILDGLAEGEEIVLEANFLLDAQAQLFGGYEDFNPAPVHEH